MADIQMRFGKDMLVLSGSIDAALEKQGVDINVDRQYLNIFEPEVIADALKLQSVAGARCMVTTTEDITPARLAHVNAPADGSTLARAAVEIVQQNKPEHILAAIGPCGLPLDSSSGASLKENKQQYMEAARCFDDLAFDAFFLDGFTSLDDMKCALMGIRQVSDMPIFASVLVGSEMRATEKETEVSKTNASVNLDLSNIGAGLPHAGYEVIDTDSLSSSWMRPRIPLAPELLPEAVSLMAEFGTSVVGIETADSLNRAFEYACTVAELTNLPLLVSLQVVLDPLGARQKGLTPLEDLENYTVDSMPLASEHLRRAGVQFLRATGEADARYTAGLYAAVAGMDVIERSE